jgi:hypothetical protein
MDSIPVNRREDVKGNFSIPPPGQNTKNIKIKIHPATAQ